MSICDTVRRPEWRRRHGSDRADRAGRAERGRRRSIAEADAEAARRANDEYAVGGTRLC